MMTGLSKARNERQTRQRGIFSSLFDDFMNDRFFSSFESPMMNNRYSIPAANIEDQDNCYMISIAAPGLEREDFDITLEENTLSISAEDRGEHNNENYRYTRKEYNYRTFQRSFTLPQDIQRDNIEANYKNGILYVKICKDEDAIKKNQSMKIDVK